MSVITSYKTVLLVVHLAILCEVHGQHTYWIAPHTSQCGGRTPCQTLDSYARNNASLFSTSHTRWVFLRGQHNLGEDIDIEHATNITLTGEYPCSSTRSEQCSSALPRKITSAICVKSAQFFMIHNMTELVITNLRFECFLSSLEDDIMSNFQRAIFLHHIHNLTIQGSIIDTSLEIVKPSGLVYISQVTANHLWMEITNPLTPPHSAECEIRPDTCKQFWVNATIVNSTFSTIQKIPIIGSGRGNVIIITDEEEDSHNRSVQCHNSSYATTVHFSHCVFRGAQASLYLEFRTKTPCTQVKISNCDFLLGIAVYNVLDFMLMGSHRVEVENSRFIDNEVIDIIVIEYYAMDDHHNTDKDIHFNPTIIINNCTFENNSVQNSVIRTICQTRKSGYQHICMHLAFHGHNIFLNNRDCFGRDTKLCTWNSRFILALEKVMVGVSGVVEIETNGIDVATMTVSPNSKILLHNNSQLRIVNNINPSTTAQVLVYYSRDTFQQFLEECNMDGCDGRCLFQFVDDNGMYIGEDDLEYFNASIVLSNRGSSGETKEDTQPHYLTYNANVHNCTLTLREGNKTLEDDEKRRFLKLDSWDNTTFPMVHPAYYICSCDPTQPEDRSLWDCSNGTITSTVYPGLSVRVGIVAVGYYGVVKEAKFTYSAKINIKSGEHHNAVVDNKGCTELTPLGTGMPGKNYTLKVNVSYTLHSTPLHIDRRNILDFTFLKIRIVQVSQTCPAGFQLSPSNNGTTCECNQLLSTHHFQCAIVNKGVRSEITYKSSTNNYWMGYSGQQLVFSDHCPSHYCNTVNSTISTTGLNMEDINTTIQCDPNSNRQGLLCSQCTPGTSSQFGSFRCTQCTFAGLLLVPFGAVAGIVLILILFLFNFTVLQGDIIGIAFYANVVGIMDEFLLKYSNRPFYIILALINLGLGFETCFFDGMDEFSKAIVQFIFPFYLIALLIIIIIAAHKYNLKVFRIRFVARRSVPVLATIMLLTYSGLINAVIYGLQYTHIYNVDSGTHQVVWLHQPELEYFKGKHIAVGALCLVVTVFYLLPLTIVTLFGDLFRICSHNLWYSHFLDVFHGAFRYPFGFWFGTRLLFRIIFITLKITTNTPVLAYTIFLTTGSIILLQLLMEPFRTDNVIIYRPDPERKITRRDLMKARISKMFRPKVIDSLFLFNIMFITTGVSMSDKISSPYTIVGVCLSISLALAQLITVTVHHTYHYFPLPDSTPQRVEGLRERFIGFKERMRERRRARRNWADTPDSAPVQIHYLSASMCFNSEEYTSSSSSGGEESDSERNGDDETRGETEDETREETTEM